MVIKFEIYIEEKEIKLEQKLIKLETEKQKKYRNFILEILNIFNKYDCKILLPSIEYDKDNILDPLFGLNLRFLINYYPNLKQNEKEEIKKYNLEVIKKVEDIISSYIYPNIKKKKF